MIVRDFVRTHLRAIQWRAAIDLIKCANGAEKISRRFHANCPFLYLSCTRHFVNKARTEQEVVSRTAYRLAKRYDQIVLIEVLLCLSIVLEDKMLGLL